MKLSKNLSLSDDWAVLAADRRAGSEARADFEARYLEISTLQVSENRAGDSKKNMRVQCGRKNLKWSTIVSALNYLLFALKS